MTAAPLLGLTACQTVESPRHTFGNPAQDAKPAGFRLAAQRVVWQTTTSLSIKYDVSNKASEGSRRYTEADTKVYFRALVQRMDKEVAPLLQDKLKSAKAMGDEHFVLLTPTLGEHFSASLGTGLARLTVKVEVMARDGRVLWAESLRFNQKHAFLYDASLPKPSDTAVPELVDGVLLAFREVGLIA